MRRVALKKAGRHSRQATGRVGRRQLIAPLTGELPRGIAWPSKRWRRARRFGDSDQQNLGSSPVVRSASPC